MLGKTTECPLHHIINRIAKARAGAYVNTLKWYWQSIESVQPTELASIGSMQVKRMRMPTTTSIILGFGVYACVCACVLCCPLSSFLLELLPLTLCHSSRASFISLVTHALYIRAFCKMHKRFVSLIDFGFQCNICAGAK